MGIDRINEILQEKAKQVDFDTHVKQSSWENLEDAVSLNWVGQMVQRTAIANYQGESISPFKPYSDEGTYKPTAEELMQYPLEQAIELQGTTSTKEAERIKLQWKWNQEHREDLALNDAWGAELAAGFIDPANFIPMVGMKRGLGWLKNTRSAIPGAALGVIPTELLRHELDPTSTMAETLMGMTFGTVLGAGFAGTIGTLGDKFAARAGANFGRYIEGDQPAPDETHTGTRFEAYTEEQFNEDYPGAAFTYEDFINNKVDDGLGDVHRYQETGNGAKYYVVSHEDGTYDIGVVSEEGAGNILQGVSREEVVGFLDNKDLFRVESFDSYDAHVIRGADRQEFDNPPPIDDETIPDEINPDELTDLGDVPLDKIVEPKEIEFIPGETPPPLLNRQPLSEGAIDKWNEMVRDGVTARGMGDWLGEFNPNEDFKTIWNQIREHVPDYKVHFVTDDHGAAGRYYWQSDDISISVREDGLPNFNKSEWSEVVLHELIHAASVRRVQNWRSIPRSELPQEAASILDELDDMIRILSQFKDDTDLSPEFDHFHLLMGHAIKDPHELIAMGLTNPQVRLALAKIKWDGKITFWDKFVDVMRKILGLQNRDLSQLDRLLSVFNETLRNPNTPIKADIDSQISNRYPYALEPKQELGAMNGRATDSLGVRVNQSSPTAIRKKKRDIEVQKTLKDIDDQIKAIDEELAKDPDSIKRELRNERDKLKRLLENKRGRLDKAAQEQGISPAELTKRLQARINEIGPEIRAAGKSSSEGRKQLEARLRMLMEDKGRINQFLDEIEAEGLSAEDFAIKDGLFGFDRVLGVKQMPWYRLSGTKLREIAPGLAGKWIRTARKLAGSPDLLQGSTKGGTGASVEGLAKQWEGKLIDAMIDIDKEFSRMNGGGEHPTSFEVYAKDQIRGVGQFVNKVTDKVTGRAHDTTVDQNPPRLAEFYDMVGEAMMTGRHDNPHVMKAARRMQDYLDEVGEQLDELGLTFSDKGMYARITRVRNRLEGLKGWVRDAKTPEAKDKAKELINQYNNELKWLEKQRELRRDPNLFKDKEPFFHRVWDGQRIKDDIDNFREILTNHFAANPYVIRDGEVVGLSTHPDAIAKRVDDAIAQILDEVDTGDTLGIVKKNPDNAGTPSELMGRTLDIPNSLVKDYIVRDVRLVNSIYNQRVAPQIEMAKQFGDTSMKRHLEDLELEALDSGASKEALDEVAELIESARDLRDVVLGNYYTGPDPSSLTSRTIRGLMQYNMITSMGKVLYVTLNDVGKGIMTFGFQKAFGGIFRKMLSDVRDGGEFSIAAQEVKLAGEAHDVQTNQRAYEIMGAHGDMIAKTRLEQGINRATGATFIMNLMSPWTDHVKGTFGGMMQSRMIEDALNWANLDPKRKAELSRIGFTERFAATVADNWKRAGSQKGETMYLANTGNWLDKGAAEQFRGMLADEVNRLVMTPGAATQPLFVHNDWGRLVTQYKKFSMVATQNLLMAGVQRKEARFLAAVGSMIAISALVDAVKRPDYVELSLADSIYRAIEISGVTGILLDANQMVEGATGGEWGARAALGLKNVERDPTLASRSGALFGPVVNQWGTLTQAMVDPSQDTADMGRAIRYTVPWNNMLWWDDVTTRLQRTAVETIEDFEDE